MHNNCWGNEFSLLVVMQMQRVLLSAMEHGGPCITWLLMFTESLQRGSSDPGHNLVSIGRGSDLTLKFLSVSAIFCLSQFNIMHHSRTDNIPSYFRLYRSEFDQIFESFNFLTMGYNKTNKISSTSFFLFLFFNIYDHFLWIN